MNAPRIGDEVDFNSHEGFSAPGRIIGFRDGDYPYHVEYEMGVNKSRAWAMPGEVELRGKSSPESFAARDGVVRQTAAHIQRVGELLADCISELAHRAVKHDASKWSEEEWLAFAASTPKLAGLTYGTEEYRAALLEIKPALDHHYKANGHHPEHFANGVDGMTLLDLIEMLCDWKAAAERHNDGSITKSLEHNRVRFGISPQLEAILANTARAKGWIS